MRRALRIDRQFCMSEVCICYVVSLYVMWMVVPLSSSTFLSQVPHVTREFWKEESCGDVLLFSRSSMGQASGGIDIK